MFQTPYRATDLMDKICKTYSLWYNVWSITYVPHMMDRQKWHVSAPNLKVGHIVYFKLTESKMSADWRVGRVEFVKISDDGVVRIIGIAYKTEIGESFSIVERPSRAVIRLFHLEDTCLMDQIKLVEEFAKELLCLEKNCPRKLTDLELMMLEMVLKTNLGMKKKRMKPMMKFSTIEEHSKPGEIVTISEDSSEEEEVVVKRRKTEVEKLEIENLEFEKPLRIRRPKANSCTNQFCSAHWITSMELDQAGT